MLRGYGLGFDEHLMYYVVTKDLDFRHFSEPKGLAMQHSVALEPMPVMEVDSCQMQMDFLALMEAIQCQMLQAMHQNQVYRLWVTYHAALCASFDSSLPAES